MRVFLQQTTPQQEASCLKFLKLSLEQLEKTFEKIYFNC